MAEQRDSDGTVLVGPHRDSTMWVGDHPFCRTLRGVRKVRGQDGEEARAVAGELQSKGGGKQETHTQHQVEECPWLRGSLLD